MMRSANHPLLPRSAVPVLAVVASGYRMGMVFRSGDGRLAFVYDERWLAAPNAYPLSLCMPLSAGVHGNGAIKTWLWGLLPDDPKVLDGWGRRFGVSSVDLVGLLTHVGKDCAGAVQFVRPDDVDALLDPCPDRASAEAADGAVEWITEADIARRLRTLRADAAAGRRPGDGGQFSLAGAQPKTALFQSVDGTFGVPAGRWPTNRILKPSVLDFAAFAWNEHLCLELVRRLGWRGAQSTVRTFTDDRGTEEAIVVERYDRITQAGRLTRVHQEDCCQSLRVLPTKKYEAQGGPTAERIVALITNASSAATDDRWRFLDALALNWLIAGTDAHAKNFSLLLAGRGQVRLAPLYDVISLLPYPEQLQRDSTLAMSIGGERRLDAIGRAHWERLGAATGVGRATLVDRIAQVAERTAVVARDMREERAGTPFVEILMPAIEAHARRCLARLAR